MRDRGRENGSSEREGRKKVIWFGFDGASKDFFDKFIADGDMPNVERLRDRGVFAESLPVTPCDTPTNWTALQTGAFPGTTEVVSFFTHRPGDPLNVAHSNLHSKAVKADTIWEAVERDGGRCIVLNWPCSWPSRLKRGVQINGTGPFTASWRIGFGRLYLKGMSSTQKLDPAMAKQFGAMSENIELTPATEWTDPPLSSRPPLTASLSLLGQEKMEWSEIGMQISDPDEPGDHHGEDLYILVVAEGDHGYDRVLLSAAKDGSEVVATLALGEWSDWVRQSFPSASLLDQIVEDDRPNVVGMYKWKLIELADDASSLVLYRTDIWQEDGWSFPPEVARELVQAVGPFTEGIELAPPSARILDEWATFQQQVDMAADWYVNAATELGRNGEWDLLAVQLHLQDGINHVLARDICPEDEGYAAEKEAVAWEQLRAAYKATDRIVGEICDRLADDNTVVCIVSDHGALPTFKTCIVAGALVRDGLMSYSQSPDGKSWEVDWSKTRAFPRRGHVWVNRKGRDPDGIVEDSEYDRVREATIRSLQSIIDPDTGQRPIVSALRKEDAAEYGMWGETVGDIITFLAPTYTEWGDYSSLPFDPATGPAIGPTGGGCAHHPYLPSARYGMWSIPAVFFLAGPEIRSGYQRKNPIRQVDVAPTLCHLLGVAPPRDAEGGVLSDVFDFG